MCALNKACACVNELYVPKASAIFNTLYIVNAITTIEYTINSAIIYLLIAANSSFLCSTVHLDLNNFSTNHTTATNSIVPINNIKNVLLAKCIFHSLTLHIVQKELIKYIKQYINAGFAISPLNNLYVKIVIIRKKRTRI